ncbi:MAG TPA: NUDIX domain-containing protein [Candidatus Saccharimonadales bacterium]|nr:NUDIX domain-containing protein [Candidatus Saccharimonadales bacterium]
MPHTLIDTGTWSWGNEGVAWELYRASALPSPDDCTAAFCVAITRENKIVLEREERGWGMLGGHIDDDETIEQALKRECLEEGGFVVQDPILFGYRKITAEKPVVHPTPGRTYPFPVSYIAYYYAVSDIGLVEPAEKEVLQVSTFSLAEIGELNISDFSTIKLGWDVYQGTP